MIPCLNLTSSGITIFSTHATWDTNETGSLRCSGFSIDNLNRPLYNSNSGSSTHTTSATIYDLIQSCNGWIENYNIVTEATNSYGSKFSGIRTQTSTALLMLTAIICLPVKNNASIYIYNNNLSTAYSTDFYYGIGHAEEFNINTIWS